MSQGGREDKNEEVIPRGQLQARGTHWRFLSHTKGPTAPFCPSGGRSAERFSEWFTVHGFNMMRALMCVAANRIYTDADSDFADIYFELPEPFKIPTPVRRVGISEVLACIG